MLHVVPAWYDLPLAVEHEDDVERTHWLPSGEQHAPRSQGFPSHEIVLRPVFTVPPMFLHCVVFTTWHIFVTPGTFGGAQHTTCPHTTGEHCGTSGWNLLVPVHAAAVVSEHLPDAEQHAALAVDPHRLASSQAFPSFQSPLHASLVTSSVQVPDVAQHAPFGADGLHWPRSQDVLSLYAIAPSTGGFMPGAHSSAWQDLVAS